MAAIGPSGFTHSITSSFEPVGEASSKNIYPHPKNKTLESENTSPLDGGVQKKSRYDDGIFPPDTMMQDD
jgi:hypothetical protein